MSDKAAVVFTYKSVERILGDGGTQSWRMHASHFGQIDYVICARNSLRGPEGPEEHRSGFLIGKVTEIVPSTDPEVIESYKEGGKPRFLILMSEAALIDIPGLWTFGRWPVHFTTLSELGIDPSTLDFKPLLELLAEVKNANEEAEEVLEDLRPARSPMMRPAEYIEAAKATLATQIGVSASQIDISIRF